METADTASARSGFPACDVDFFADEYLTDPVSAYHRMLAAGSVVWLPKNGLHAICGY